MIAPDTQAPHKDAFDPETTLLMGAAYEAACKALNIPPTPDAREAAAVRIIDAAAAGERDLARLIARGASDPRGKDRGRAPGGIS